MQAPRRVNQFLDTATDNVGSNEQQNIRKDSKGNVGLIFMKGDLKEVSEEVAKYKLELLLMLVWLPLLMWFFHLATLVLILHIPLSSKSCIFQP